MKIKRFIRTGTAFVLSLSSLLTVAIPLAHAATQTCEWTGGGSDTKFSTVANWTNCGGAAPQAGDMVQFGYSGVAQGTYHLTNDLGVALGGIDQINGGSTQTYFIDTLTLADGATLLNEQASSNTSTVVGIGTDYSALSAVTAQGNLTLDGAVISTSAINVAGNLTLKNGTRDSVKASNTGVTGRIIVENGAELFVDPESVTSPTFSTALTLGGGTGTSKPAVGFEAVCVAGGGGCNNEATSWTVNSAVTLLNDAYFSPDALVSVNYTGAISGANYSLTVDPSAQGSVTLNPSSNDSKTVVGAQTPQKVTNTITDDQPTTDITVGNNVTTVLDGSRGRVEVGLGGLLMGTGTVGLLVVDDGGTVAPGHSPGCLNTGNVILNGTYQAEIGGTTPCSGYDQLKVTGSVDVTSSTLQATLYKGFVPKVGQSYSIIDNDGSDAVTGTFTGIAEGGTYTNDGVTYTVTYKGGDGNDVVLTVKSIDASKLPKAPNTGMKLVAAHPMVALSFTTAAALFIAYTARRMKPAPARARARR